MKTKAKEIASIVKYLLIYLITRIFVLVIENIIKTSSDVLRKLGTSDGSTIENILTITGTVVIVLVVLISWYKLMNIVR